MMKIGRNDPCICGSGKKYKKCCIIYKDNPIKLWEMNFDKIASEIEQNENVKTIFFSILEIIQNEKWEGACHATAAIMYVLFNELRMESQLCIGEVQYGDYIFDHSWIEINGRVYDAAVYMGLRGLLMSEPIIAGYNIDTLKKTEGKYAVSSVGGGLDFPAKVIKDKSISEYVDDFPFHEDGLWGMVSNIGVKVGIDIDVIELRKKYLSEGWKLK